jgi:hypothetical protein
MHKSRHSCEPGDWRSWDWSWSQQPKLAPNWQNSQQKLVGDLESSLTKSMFWVVETITSNPKTFLMRWRSPQRHIVFLSFQSRSFFWSPFVARKEWRWKRLSVFNPDLTSPIFPRRNPGIESSIILFSLGVSSMLMIRFLMFCLTCVFRQRDWLGEGWPQISGLHPTYARAYAGKRAVICGAKSEKRRLREDPMVNSQISLVHYS